MTTVTIGGFKKWACTAMALGALSACGNALADAQEEVDKQIAKLIGDAVSARIAAQTVAVAGAAKSAEAATDNNLWASYSSISLDFPAIESVPSSSNRTGTYLVGYDRSLSKQLIAGISLATADTSGSDFKYWSTSPYVAYTFSDSLFGILKGTYAETEFTSAEVDPTGSGGVRSSKKKQHAYGIDVSINGINRSGNLITKWRAGIGRTEPQTGDGVTVGSIDGEVGYDFGSGLIAFAGLQASTTDQDNSYQLSARAGIEKQFGKNSAVTLKYEQKIDDNSGLKGFDLYVVTLGVRIGF